MLPAWLPLLVLAARPAVMSVMDCPAARDVDSFLAVLLPDEDIPSGTAEVSPSAEGLMIELRPDGSLVAAHRSVAVGSDCTERAKAAAVVIATWWPSGSRGPRQIVDLPVRQVEGAYGGSLAAGGFASLVSGSAAVGARAELAVEHRRAALGLRLGVAGTAAHGDSLGQGQVHWSRASLELGPSYGHRWLRVDVGVVGSLLWIEGSGYTEDRRSTGGAFGATVGLRAAAPWGHAQPWLEVRGFGWPQSQSINVTNAETGERLRRPLPQAELHVGAGVMFSLF